MKIHLLFVVFLITFSYGLNLEEDNAKADYLRQLKQPYNASMNLVALQKSLEEYQCVFGIPINVYDPSIIYPQGCQVLLLRHPETLEEVKVVFKPRRKLIQDLSVGAFFIAHFLGMETLIPPVSPYQYEGKDGIMSYFVDTRLEDTFWKVPGNATLIKETVSIKSLSDYYIFCYLLGNWDVKWRNVVLVDVDSIKEIVCVDIDAIASPGQGSYGDHFFVPWFGLSRNTTPYAVFTEEDAFFMSKSDVDSHLDEIFPFFEYQAIIQEQLIMSQKYALVSQKAKSLALWERPPTKHYIDEQAWWIKVYDHIPEVPPPFTKLAHPMTIEGLHKLDMRMLKILFNDIDPTMPLVNEEFYTGILGRRDAMCQTLESF